MKNVARSLFISVIIAFVAFGCAANKQVTDTDTESAQAGEQMEDYFGTSGETESSESLSDEQEVLRLLGISASEKAESETGVADAATTEDTGEVPAEQNDNAFMKMEQEIATLKAALERKDQKIRELETQPATEQKVKAAYVAGDFEEDYQYALAEYNNRNYKDAISIFESLLTRDSNNSLSDNCQYWIGEAYYGLKNFNQAIVEFTKVFSFTNSNKADAAQLKLGLCYVRLGETAKAREEFQRLITDYPDSEFVARARRYLAQ
ncbi:MAG: tetratricopeptide repeat protein [candidate division KSB1 bacterium]|jgi:tol-pal system protein YbgF|nr:tetratricopeptide repeat protein [candidate division KSB1 bacterium]